MGRPRKVRPYRKNPNNPRWGKVEQKRKKNDVARPFLLHAESKRYTVSAIVVDGYMRFGVSVTKRADMWSEQDNYDPTIGERLSLKRAKSMYPDAIVKVYQPSKTIDLFRSTAPMVGAKIVSEVEGVLKVKEELYGTAMGTFSREWLRKHPNFTKS